MEIREATAADWTEIWPFLHGIVAAGETFTWPRDVSEERACLMWMKEPPGRTVVAVENGTILGTANMNPNHMGPASHIASASFMVAPAHAGNGVGRSLGEYVMDWARAEGYRAMQFNAVVETNERAVHLWKSLGMEIVATLPDGFLHPVHGYVGLHVMYRLL